MDLFDVGLGVILMAVAVAIAAALIVDGTARLAGWRKARTVRRGGRPLRTEGADAADLSNGRSDHARS